MLDCRRRIPADRVLNLWARGFSVPQIIERIGPVDGIKFQSMSVQRTITDARKLGDPRAVRRRVSS